MHRFHHAMPNPEIIQVYPNDFEIWSGARTVSPVERTHKDVNRTNPNIQQPQIPKGEGHIRLIEDATLRQSIRKVFLIILLAAQTLTFIGIKVTFTKTNVGWRDFNQLVIFNIGHRLFKRHTPRRGQANSIIFP